MLCELSKLDLWMLLRGVNPPSHEWYDKLEHLNLGHYVGGFADRWQYNSTLEMPDLSEEELWNLYKQMTDDIKQFYSKFGVSL